MLIKPLLLEALVEPSEAPAAPDVQLIKSESITSAKIALAATQVHLESTYCTRCCLPRSCCRPMHLLPIRRL